MDRIAYVNGEYVPESRAGVSIFDRGFLFADAAYEVTAVIGARLIDFPAHARRLSYSLGELRIDRAASESELLSIHRALVERNGVEEGSVYLQVSRGAADRSFFYPDIAESTVIAFTQEKRIVDHPAVARGVHVTLTDDLRWGRRDIKTVQLLYSSMARTHAAEAGYDDAWLTQDGVITEATSSNAFIVTEGRLVTHPLDRHILPGITRSAVIELAVHAGLGVEERAFTVDEARRADEAFMTSSTTVVLPVVKIDDLPVGDGVPGPITRELRRRYFERLSE